MPGSPRVATATVRTGNRGPTTRGPSNTADTLGVRAKVAHELQENAPRRPRLPLWLARVCRCPTCGEWLLVTDGGYLACFWTGHTGLIVPGEFARRLEVARLAARKVAVVNLTEAAALRLAWRVVRENSPAASPPAATGKPPTPDLFTAADEPQTGPFVAADHKSAVD